MPAWYTQFHLSDDPFSEDSASWSYYYGGRYGIASLQLEQAIDKKRGVIVISGPPGTGKSALVRNTLSRLTAASIATVSAAQATPTSVIDVLLRSREPLEGGFSATRKRAALMVLIEQARASNRPIVCIIEDAHLARPGQLKDLLAAIHIAPDAFRVFQVILIGRPALRTTLQARMLRELTARTTVRIDTEPLTLRELAEFLTERLEAAEASMPDLILPPPAMAAIAHHSRGIIGLAAALARTSLERAAETGAETATGELVDEVASLYGGLPADAAGQSRKHSLTRIIATGAVAALIALALVVAAAEVQLLGSGGRRVKADLHALAGFGRGDDGEAGSARGIETAQLGTPREKFLGRGNSASGSEPQGKEDASKPYEVQIKPPQRPDSAGGAGSAAGPGSKATGTARAPEPEIGNRIGDRETVITVPGIPGPLTPPATDSATARNAPSPADLEAGPRVALQVGAFRERASAEALKNELTRKFSEVYVSTIHSGGEPLYRVRVGRFTSPDETTPLRSRLQAAGYASFRVTEP